MSDNVTNSDMVRLTIFGDHESTETDCVAHRPQAVDRAMGTLLDRLDTAEMTLQSANFRIGYLQAEVDKYRDHLRLLPDVQTASRKAAQAERRHEELLKQLPEMEMRLQRLPKMQRDNELLRLQVEEVCAEPTAKWWQVWKRLSPRKR